VDKPQRLPEIVPDLEPDLGALVAAVDPLKAQKAVERPLVGDDRIEVDLPPALHPAPVLRSVWSVHERGTVGEE
jgi:hypothetical protein